MKSKIRSSHFPISLNQVSGTRDSRNDSFPFASSLWESSSYKYTSPFFLGKSDLTNSSLIACFSWTRPFVESEISCLQILFYCFDFHIEFDCSLVFGPVPIESCWLLERWLSRQGFYNCIITRNLIVRLFSSSLRLPFQTEQQFFFSLTNRLFLHFSSFHFFSPTNPT